MSPFLARSSFLCFPICCSSSSEVVSDRRFALMAVGTNKNHVWHVNSIAGFAPQDDPVQRHDKNPDTGKHLSRLNAGV
jgi:hypothetical protein